MHEIDFLPAEYRKKNAGRQWQSMRIVVVAALAIVLCGAAAVEWHSRCAAQRELDELIPRFDLAQSQGNLLAKLQSQVQTAQAQAELYTYLRHPWPRSRIMASVLAPLPESVTLAELRIVREIVAGRPGPITGPPPPVAGPQQVQQVPAPEKDLKWLREKYDATRTVVYLQGACSDVGAMYQYVEQLSKDPLFLKAESQSIERAPGNEAGLMLFRAQIVVRPGFGQAYGPTGPALAAAKPAPSEGAASGGVR